MTDIDRQRWRGVELLRDMGFVWREGRWHAPTAQSAVDVVAEADEMLRLLIERADHLDGCTEARRDEAELARIGDAIGAYEAKRWPKGKEAGGKG